MSLSDTKCSNSSSGSSSNTEEKAQARRTNSAEIQNSFIQKIPSFERDDDLTVVTTAGSEERDNNLTSDQGLEQAANQDDLFVGFNGSSTAPSDDDKFNFDLSSMSIRQQHHQARNQSSPNRNFAAPATKSSLAAANTKLSTLNPHAAPVSHQHRPSSLVSALTSNSSNSYKATPPPPGFVSPITSVKSESRTLRNKSGGDSFLNKGGYHRDKRPHTTQKRHENYSNNYQKNNNQKYQSDNRKSLYGKGGIWGSSTHQDNFDLVSDGSYRMPSVSSVTMASSTTQSTASHTTYMGSWKNNNQSEIERQVVGVGKTDWNTNYSQTSYHDGGGTGLPPLGYQKETSSRQKDKRYHPSLSPSYQSFSSKGSNSYQNNNVTSNAVQSILSSPSVLLQSQAMYTAELAQSSSSNSSHYSDCVDGPFAYGLNIREDSTPSKQKILTSSFAIPPLKKSNSNTNLPVLPKHSSSSELDDKLNISLDEDALNTTFESHSTKARSPRSKKREWRFKMNRKLADIPIGELNPEEVPIAALMNEWAKTKSLNGATMVETLLNRAKSEMKAGNTHPAIQLTTKSYTIAVDAWAKSKQGVKAAHRAEAILQHMNEMYKTTKNDNLKPTTGIFNAVVNAWAQSKDENAALRCEQILNWMDTLHKNGHLNVKPDSYTYNTVMHALAQNGGKESAAKALGILDKMHQMYKEGNQSSKPETISFNIVINALAKSKEPGAAAKAENLLQKMHTLYESGDLDVKPNVVSYCAVIDAYAKSMESGAATRGDTMLANMIQIYQSDPVTHADLRPNTHVFNTLINCWSKSVDEDAASKAEEVLIAMSSLQDSGIHGIKPDAFSYTAVIDAWAKSGHSGAALRAEALLNRMELKYMSGDVDLKPTTYTYNAVIHALAKSGEAQAASRAERVLQNMVNRYRAGGTDVMPTTINFNTVLGAWAKSNSGRAGAERAEKVLEWMDELRNSENSDVKPDTISFNACIDAWARSGDRMAAERAEQILCHMDQLYASGNTSIKADSYSYNTVLNAWAKSGEVGAPQRAERILSVMEGKYRNGDISLKPNTRSYTTVIDAWAKSDERNSARKAEQILIGMQTQNEMTNDYEARPNTATANAVMNSCAFTKVDSDKSEALSIAFRVFEWLSSQKDISPDAYTYTIMLSVCSNLLPRRDTKTRYSHARKLFLKCRESGHVNDFVLRKLRHTVTEEEYMSFVEYRVNSSARNLPAAWTRNAGKLKGRGGGSSGKSKGRWNNNNGR